MESLDDSEDNRAATALAASLDGCDSCTGFTDSVFGRRKLGGDCGESLAVGVDMGVENSSELSKELRLL